MDDKLQELLDEGYAPETARDILDPPKPAEPKPVEPKPVKAPKKPVAIPSA